MTALLLKHERRQPLKSVILTRRTLYLNGDPRRPYLFPLCNSWTVNELSETILRGAFEYDIIATWEGANALAVKLAKEIEKETLEGGFELGWD
ncbi:hypothetical protein [Nitrososphaera sp.]|uniref:hypothetical protein n=1 Tax=Nitrososphaera sp. TaxID=1971748 RepID=UPI002ED90067